MHGPGRLYRAARPSTLRAVTNEERLRAMFAAFNERRLADSSEFMDEHVVFDSRALEIVGNEDVFYGIEQVARFWSDWLPSWRHVQPDIVWAGESGDRVVAWVHQTMTGKESGVETWIEYAWDTNWRDGKLIRVSLVLDEAEARRVAGLD